MPNVTYVADLTTEEFKQLMVSTISEMLGQQSGSKWVTGVPGLMEIFGCSASTAKRIKASGAISKAIRQQGRTFVVNVPLALQLYGSTSKNC